MAPGSPQRRWFFVVAATFMLVLLNSIYLLMITGIEAMSSESLQNVFYLVNFLGHIGLGLGLLVAVAVYAYLHVRFIVNSPVQNPGAVRIGILILTAFLILVLSGLLLLRFDFLVIKDPVVRATVYWAHLGMALGVVLLFVIHRRLGRPVSWPRGWPQALVACTLIYAVVALFAHVEETSRRISSSSLDLTPSLARTADGHPMSHDMLMQDKFCAECHADAHEQWKHSVHRFSSFNNPAYLASVRETREVLIKRDGNPNGVRFCAACHDPVPLLSGRFDTLDFDKVNDITARAGITCTVCHAISEVGTRGNGDYLISLPEHYPLTFSDSDLLRSISRQLIKARPALHKKTFLKPIHRTAEFCSTCHKVFIPESFNGYRWLRGQNHYDAFLLSGVSGHGVSSFYYPKKAVPRCSSCHMQAVESEDFGARQLRDDAGLAIHHHGFAAANAAIIAMAGLPEELQQAHQEFLDGAMRVDIFALKEGKEIDSRLTAPLRPVVPTLVPGGDYLLEIVVRTVKLGHTFTQGTADSNEVWLDVKATSGGRLIGRSGAMRPEDGQVDPWSYFLNSYVLDKDGNRINRRNVQDIVTALYNHQIPPGAADVILYRLHVPDDATDAIDIEVTLNYRKFDTEYLNFIQGEMFKHNDLPVLKLATDRIRFLLAETTAAVNVPAPAIPTWERWNDYGIGMLRKARSSALRFAESAFREVEVLGRTEGSLNLARVYLKDARLQEARILLNNLRGNDQLQTPWTLDWLDGMASKQLGDLDAAAAMFERLVQTDYAEARARDFDFSLDYRLLNELGQTRFEQAKRLRRPAEQALRRDLLDKAINLFDRVLAIDYENTAAHYNLSLVYAELGDSERASRHREFYLKYRPDDTAAAIAARHRRGNPAADHAAEPVAIYDLQRPGSYGLADSSKQE
jgi:tetratricopeptide (TPR) repeat protein